MSVIGLLPVLAGALTRWAPVREWAAIETTRLLNEQLGLHANYQVRVSLWPLGLELREADAPPRTASRLGYRGVARAP